MGVRIDFSFFSSLIGTGGACLPVGREDRKNLLSSMHKLYSCVLSLLVQLRIYI